MKVYLVYNEYYDHDEYASGSMLLGIYSSMESAIAARDEFVAAELAEASEMDCPARQSLDYDNNPTVDKFCCGELVESNVYTIEEWCVSP